VSSWKGTVMSYCHLVSRGISLANGFGPLPGAQVRNYVSGLSFLSPTLEFSLTPSPICNNDGAVSLQLPSSLFGTAPFHYAWSNSATSQNLSGLSSPGTYSVTVTDSNGCSNSLSTEVKNGRASGMAETPIIALPICCNKYNAPLILNATPPKGITSCQTVYWLRSKSVFGSTDEAKAYFDTASTADILPSANDSSIANDVTGAELHVIPEPCTSSSTWYFTPVVVQRAHNADSIQYTTTGSSSLLSYGSVQIGGKTSLPDQTKSPSTCDLLDTPTLKSLRVIITGYTGRPDRLRIAITDINDRVMYMSENLHGAGSYYIPDSLINGNMLEAMNILGFDYNCTTSTSNSNVTTCTGASCTVSAFRKVVYGAHPARLTSDCPLSDPIRIVWAPNGCSMLAVQPDQLFSDLKIVPNPASSSARIRFRLAQTAHLNWTMSDMTGRIILNGQGQYAAGAHEEEIDLRSVAKGMYLISLSDGISQTQRSKLVVE
ncbi:MAG: T9SS type A sorting domain-containing protein, partial [Bacteroidetes bacterium]|nr:T9SS type A sorting domain-containing protein [Bacteroidota bacterium]